LWNFSETLLVKSSKPADWASGTAESEMPVYGSPTVVANQYFESLGIAFVIMRQKKACNNQKISLKQPDYRWFIPAVLKPSAREPYLKTIRGYLSATLAALRRLRETIVNGLCDPKDRADC
jgi:hypothetical protein